MTVEVTVDGEGIIVQAAPIVKKFQGQGISNLIYWMKKQGGFLISQLGVQLED